MSHSNLSPNLIYLVNITYIRDMLISTVSEAVDAIDKAKEEDGENSYIIFLSVVDAEIRLRCLHAACHFCTLFPSLKKIRCWVNRKRINKIFCKISLILVPRLIPDCANKHCLLASSTLIHPRLLHDLLRGVSWTDSFPARPLVLLFVRIRLFVQFN